jgi:RNA polymerase sigma factor (sigma-70 family)
MFCQSVPMLRAFVRRFVSDREQASEVLQEVSVQILAGQGPAEPERFAAWCRGVARHVISHQWRLRRRALAEMPLEAELMDEISNPFADPEGNLDARVWMARIIDGLDTEGLELLYRRYVLEETGKELADELSQSPAAVRMRLMRLRTAVSAHAPRP